MRITVFTPTLNRASLLPRVFQALQAQDFHDFEWLIFDDGSWDDTQLVVDELKNLANFEIVYEYQENIGKTRSINKAVFRARGELFLVLDSDDWCVPHALSRFLEVWDGLGSKQSEYCSISCLKTLADGAAIGEGYSKLSNGEFSYVDRFNAAVKGDKWEFISTKVHRENLYELAEFEKYMAPEYAWLKMGKSYKTVFLDEALGIVEYQPDGISRNNILHRLGSPQSACRFYEYALSCATTKRQKVRMAANYTRFALHGKSSRPFASQNSSGIGIGFALYCGDLMGIVKRKARDLLRARSMS